MHSKLPFLSGPFGWRLAAVFLLLNAFCFFSSFAQLPAKEVDKLVERALQTFGAPGVAVAVVQKGKVIHSKGYGVRSLNTREKVDEHTLFGIASNTKAFTAAALGLLVDEQKLDWDDKVTKYIPEFQLQHAYVTQEFTIRDLLTHRSGLGLGAGDLMIFPDSADFSIQELIHNLRFLPSVSSFRSKYDYDNLLYIVAGEVVTRVAGRPYEDFVEERLLRPVGMSRSAANYDRLKDKSNIIDAHEEVEGKLTVVPRYTQPLTGAAGGIYSSVHDLSKWVLLQLNKGKYGERQQERLFSERVHAEMWTPQTLLPVRADNGYNTHFAAYGLGWFMQDVKGYKELSHTGGLPGMVTQVTLLPELELGIIVLTNQPAGAVFRSITDQIKDSYLSIKGRDRVKEYQGFSVANKARAQKVTDEVWKKVNAKKGKAPSNAAAVLGTYRDNWLGDVEITRQGDRLQFRSRRSPKLVGEMVPYEENTYIIRWKDRSMNADAFARFELDTQGKAAGLKLQAVSPLTDFSFDFQDLDFRAVPAKRE